MVGYTHAHDRRFRPSSRALLGAFLAASIVLGACSSDGSTDLDDRGDPVADVTTTAAASAPETPSSTAPAPSDEDVASAALLTIGDFPAGWTEQPVDDDTEASRAVSRQMAACTGRTAETIVDVGGPTAESPEFAAADLPHTVEHAVGVAASAAEASAAMDAFGGPDVVECVQDVYRSSFAELIENPPTPEASLPAGTVVGEVAVERLEISGFGDDVDGVRMTIPISSDTFDVVLIADMAIVRVDRVVSAVMFTSQGQPYPASDRDLVLSTAVERATTAAS